MNQAYIFIGTNIDRERNYIQALKRLRELGKIVRISPVYRTAPVGGHGEDFYNGAVLLKTPLNAHALKQALHAVEEQMGRVRSRDRNAPRTIDLDLVLYNHDQIEDGLVHVPDPLILKRPFLAQALAELNPGYVHPENGRTLEEIAAGLTARADGIHLEPAMTAQAMELFRQYTIGEMTNA